MKTTLLSTLIALIGFNAQAALIEGHFYANTCGTNEVVATSQTSPKRILIRNNESVVEKVCHGNVLRNGAYIETVRLYLVDAQNEHVDFTVTARYVEETNDRSLLRRTILMASNEELGNVEFLATSVYKTPEILAIHTQGNMDKSVLSFTTSDMEKMMNITAAGPEVSEM